MKTIWNVKFNWASLSDEMDFSMPQGSEILYVAEQYPGTVGIWFRCDPSMIPVPHTILIRGTGHPNCPETRHIGSIITAKGDLVFHFFDGGEAVLRLP